MSLAQYLFDIIFPPTCLACKDYLKSEDEKSRYICDVCSLKLDYLPGFLCPVCFRRLPAEVLTKAGLPPCHQDAQFILAAPLSYGNPIVRELIHVLKYNSLKTAAEPLVSVLAWYLSASFENCKLSAGGGSAFGGKIENFNLVPIPLHPSKERKRGFNQALVIADRSKEVLKLNAEVLSEVLVKISSTPSQTKQKNYEAREENIRGSFDIKKPELVSGKNILLIDDIFTSGATMREATRVLKLSGAKKIIAVTVARA